MFGSSGRTGGSGLDTLDVAFIGALDSLRDRIQFVQHRFHRKRFMVQWLRRLCLDRGLAR